MLLHLWLRKCLIYGWRQTLVIGMSMMMIVRG
jgi:hypothetical protein